uniref:Eukaryotic translation initiation factor 3 subunit E n=1 Tax=Meloidogyne javanica TaxID=6303 RepID=A0A915MSN3_MELJA
MEYDLTRRLAPFFDLHLVIPILEFIEPRKIYDEESFKKVHLSVFRKTNMVDNLINDYSDDENLVMESMTRDREGNTKMLEYLEQKSEFKMEMLDSLYKYAKFLYECGNYLATSTYLEFYRILIPQDDPNYLNALYGKLASEILMQSWDHARDDLNRLRAYIDSDPFESELELLQHRAWFLHWSLYVLCPHLLRYLAVAVVTSKNKQKISMKDLIKVIDVERYNYQDPVTEFLSCLYIDFDFDAAQTKLRECDSVLINDFFLTHCLDDFRESSRLLIFEMFCRIHQCISLEMLANRLNMGNAEAERWIVNLIRNYRIEGAKIDSQSGQVVMSARPISIHEQVMENTKRMTIRSQQIALQLEKSKTDKKGPWKRGEREML